MEIQRQRQRRWSFYRDNANTMEIQRQRQRQRRWSFYRDNANTMLIQRQRQRRWSFYKEKCKYNGNTKTKTKTLILLQRQCKYNTNTKTKTKTRSKTDTKIKCFKGTQEPQAREPLLSSSSTSPPAPLSPRPPPITGHWTADWGERWCFPIFFMQRDLQRWHHYGIIFWSLQKVVDIIILPPTQTETPLELAQKNPTSHS